MASSGQGEQLKKIAATATVRTKGVKRQMPTVFSGDQRAFEERNSGIICPICFDIIECAYMTECGHSFCQKCICDCLLNQNRCPKCNFTTQPDKIFPNFTLDEIVMQHKHKRKIQKQSSVTGSCRSTRDVSDIMEDIINNGHNSLSAGDVDVMIQHLQQKKKYLQLETELGRTSVTLEFLAQIKNDKQVHLTRLQRELSVISKDIATIEQQASHLQTEKCQYTQSHLSNGVVSSSSGSNEPVVHNAEIRRKIGQHSSDLQNFYFSMRQQAMIGDEAQYDVEGLKDFTQALSKFVKYSDFQSLATLNYTSDMYNMYSIVSSIEFDKDSDYFAIAGVTKKIKTYDYNQVVGDVVDVHYPVSEMACTSKISCLAWNPYHKNQLASSDYEGTVTLWDPFTACRTQIFQEHEKRCWCVDFCRMNPLLLASGSDDSKVKIWSMNTNRSILNIEAKANVCCVKFNPTSSYHLAFGSADHCVHYYDLRHPKEALVTFKGHLKAVSYAKFLNGSELVSASTDSQLKMWDVNSGTSAIMTFKGHSNEKNFVGLAADSDYIACGSEDNSLCIYYKGLSDILLKYKFDVVRSAWQREAARDEDSNEFVSAVSWKPNSDVVLVANSQGIIKVLQLI